MRPERRRQRLSPATDFRPRRLTTWPAFAAFADLEDAFEPLEALVTELATDVDRKLQLQYDTARLLR
jgi:hypothetical protein